MSNPNSQDDVTALVIRSAHDLATRSSLVLRGLRDIENDFQDDPFKSTDDRALELFHQNKFEKAISICNTGLDANPKDECLWLIKGMCFSKQEKYDELLQCTLPLLEIDPTSTNYQSLAAKVLHRLHRPEEELKYWQRVLEIDPNHKGAWQAIGDCFFELEKYEESVHAFEAELKLNPSDEYSRSRRHNAFAANSGQWLSELVPTIVVTLENWWTESFPKSELQGLFGDVKSFSFRCTVKSISEKEQVLGKQISLMQRLNGGKEAYWVGDGLFVDFGEQPAAIAPHSEWTAVTFEISWHCPTEKSEEECVRELLTSADQTLGHDDKFNTVLSFAWEGE
jgi:tetratricopeptide (TPR) repeat protein